MDSLNISTISLISLCLITSCGQNHANFQTAQSVDEYLITSCDGFMHGLSCRLPDSLSKYSYPGFYNYYNSLANPSFSSSVEFYKHYLGEIDTVGLPNCSGGFKYDLHPNFLELNGFIFKKVNVNPSEFSLSNGLFSDATLCLLYVYDSKNTQGYFISQHFDDFFEKVFIDNFDENQIEKILNFYLGENSSGFQSRRLAILSNGRYFNLEAIGISGENGNLVKFSNSMIPYLVTNGLAGLPLTISSGNNSGVFEIQTINKTNDRLQLEFENNSAFINNISGFSTKFKFHESGHNVFYLDFWLEAVDNSGTMHLIYKLN